jgi:hypothetical protein
MSAIITDQFRILNAKNFVNLVKQNSFYTFVGLPNANEIDSNWDTNPPAPADNFNYHNSVWETIISLKKINESDVKLVIPKITWQSGLTYDYYRHDYSSSNKAIVSSATNLYSSRYYVMNSDYRVYICLENGTNPDNPNGQPSLDEPTFVDIEPRTAGSSGDGYIWKYLYTIKPSDIVKFESTNYIPVPSDWESNPEHSSVRNNAVDGSIKSVIIKNRGSGVSGVEGTGVYKNVPIKGDGVGAECTVVINDVNKVESVTISNQGSNYTYGNVDLESKGISSSERPVLDVIITPKGGHGYDIYKELGARNVLVYSRIENDVQNPDFITGNQIARVGIIENPKSSIGSTLTEPLSSAVYALKLTGVDYNKATFVADSEITQTVGTGITAVGKVISYNKNTGVLKYWQERTLVGFATTGSINPNPQYGFNLNRFTSSPSGEGSLTISGNTSGGTLSIQQDFTGISTVSGINNITYYLGQEFIDGISEPEVQKYSGNIIHIDNRPSITRSSNQKEDIKIILQF